MALFWLLLGLATASAVAGAGLTINGWRAYRGNKSYHNDAGFLRIGLGFVLCVAALSIGLTLASYPVARSLSHAECAKKNEVTDDRYEWIEYHYFGWDCQLRTPSGNITETPVFPIEDVTQR